MITINGVKPKIEYFGNHESNLTIPDLGNKIISRFDIVWRYENDTEIWAIKQIESILKRYLVDIFGGIDRAELPSLITCHILYMPYERMDRYDPDSYNSFSLQALISILPMYWGYIITEPHSNVTRYLMESNFPHQVKLVNKTYENLKDYINNVSKTSNYLVVFPDKGAVARYGKQYREVDYGIGEKTRDFKTHHITDYKVKKSTDNIDFASYDEFIIPDDICSYGNTFIKLSDELHKLNPKAKIVLIVTHAESVMFNSKLMSSNIDSFVFTDSLLSDNNFGENTKEYKYHYKLNQDDYLTTYMISKEVK